ARVPQALRRQSGRVRAVAEIEEPEVRAAYRAARRRCDLRRRLRLRWPRLREDRTTARHDSSKLPARRRRHRAAVYNAENATWPPAGGDDRARHLLDRA